MERCVYCQGPVDPATRRCRQCGQAQPMPQWNGPAAAPAVMPATRQCPTCGDTLPAQARFCGNCGSALPPLAAPEAQRNQAGGMAFMPAQAAQPGVGQATAGTAGKVGLGLTAKIIAAVGALTVVAASALTAYVALRPQPVIHLRSSYSVGGTPAGASSTTFAVSGEKFSGNSLVTFLLDGAPAPGNTAKETDQQGALHATLTVTDQWSVGKHTLTARDANGYTTKAGILIEIVAQGAAKTPGPNGAPTDLSSFQVNATLSPPTESSPNPTTIIVTRGMPCDPTNDTGKPITLDGDYVDPQTGVVVGTLTYTTVAVCSGSYSHGKLSYTETVNSMTFALDNGNTCQAQTPFVNRHFEGNFSNATTMSGTANGDAISITCARTDIIAPDSVPAWTATWTGTVATNS